MLWRPEEREGTVWSVQANTIGLSRGNTKDTYGDQAGSRMNPGANCSPAIQVSQLWAPASVPALTTGRREDSPASLTH